MRLLTATSQNAIKMIAKELYKHIRTRLRTHRYTHMVIFRNIHTDTYIGMVSHRNICSVHSDKGLIFRAHKELS